MTQHIDPNQQRSGCPISCALDVWGDKWSLLIVRDLLRSGTCSYGDFADSAEGIADNILSARLRMLTQEGIIERRPKSDGAKRMVYQLTPKGLDLLPILVEMAIWADKYMEISADQRALVTSASEDKAHFVQHYKEQIYPQLLHEKISRK